MSSDKADCLMTEKTIGELQGIVAFKFYEVKNIYKILREYEVKLSPAERQLIKSHFKDMKRESPWTLSDIAYALALSRKGFESYNFMRDCFPLPSMDELRSVTDKIQLNPGINQQLLKILSEKNSNFIYVDKCCLIFHEIDLCEKAWLDEEKGETLGYVNLGSLGCTNVLANRALVFMANGVHHEWKQPIAYYFIRDKIDGSTLKHLLIEVISALHSVGFIVLATVFDDRPFNQPFIEGLCYDSTTNKSNYFFKVNNKKVYCLYDPCYLLKSTRNVLYDYNIEYEKSKVAKWEYIKRAFDRDITERRYRHLSKIQKEYIYLEQYPQYKESVQVAAYTLSRKMASGIANWVHILKSPFPNEAFETCEFVQDMNNLFDTFNGSESIENENEEYRRAITSRSNHLKLWGQLTPKINSWVFIPKNGETKFTEHPLKTAWLRNIQAIKELWGECTRMRLPHLSTRSLNLDQLHNLFICIRYFNPDDSNPDCYQFVSCLKSLLLDNLRIPSTVMMAYDKMDYGVEYPVMALIDSRKYFKQEDLPTCVRW